MSRELRRIGTLAVLSMAALTAIGCGSSSKSPIAPTSTGGSGAVITGTVRSGGASIAASTSAAGQGVTVSVVGTNVRSGIDAAGRFSLSGVPAGDLQLKFTGTGVDATLSISQVQSSQTIDLVVNLAGSFATLEAERRDSSGEVQLEGRIESLPPTMAANTLKVSGNTIVTDGSTRIVRGGADRPFSDLEVGMRVHVVARPSGSNFQAVSITVQNTNTNVPVVVNGVVSDLSGNSTNFEFRIGSRVLKGDVLTEFFGNGNDDTFEDLENGQRVEVKGQQRDGFVYIARIHINGDDDEDDVDDDDGDQDSSASIHGVLMNLGSAPPNMTLTVGTTTVGTNSATVVQRRGDVQSLSVLQVGMTLHVIGDRQSDGSIDARRIHIMDDEVGDPMQIEGSAGGVQGTCPSLTFGVNGFTVVTNASTTFVPPLTCGALKSGTKVLVKGTRQANGSILATSVQ
ncbi:MAG TPA: DUF5666 domain-containing protein [Vicinamibacterales bacterium]|nr:DUF5666 domain-containing protein [Vicinamibacterales bacterium]